MDSNTLFSVSKTDAPRGQYSAVVRISLYVGNRIFFPTHTAHDELIFREPQTVPPSTGRLIISLDGVLHCSKIEILQHLFPAKRIPIVLQKLSETPHSCFSDNQWGIAA